jgi:L-gulonolactone oxidase
VSAGLQLTEHPLSWGRVLKGPVFLGAPRFVDQVPALMADASRERLSCLAIGLSRSYGDSGLNLHHAAISMGHLDRVIAFDREAGILRAEAGLTLSDAIRRVAPHGWFLPTTPGTRLVTFGGAVANDVHGKNHHRAGTFGTNVRRIGLIRSDRGLVELGPNDEPELFQATIGGLGLTGAIVWVEIQLARIESCFLDSESIPFNTLDDFARLAQDSAADHEHTVAWVDTSTALRGRARGVFTRSNWRRDGRFDLHDDAKRLSLPMDFPAFALNRLSLRVLNEFFFWRFSSPPRRRAEHYGKAFHPLDAIGGWNRLYGGRGFYQFQCVTPTEAGVEPIGEMLAEIAASGQGSFLTVLKTFGDRPSPGLLSFPRPGCTFAIDFANHGEATYRLLSRLDAITAAAGGRLYPAKDGRMPPAMMAAGYPALERFCGSIDPAFSSSFWRRVHHA